MPESREGQKRRVPIEPGFFTIPAAPSEAPRLLGCMCRTCGECFYPRRIVCARCLAETLDEIEIGPRGTLYTYTYVHVPLFGSLRSQVEGYGVGQVDLPEGPRVQAVLSGGPDDFHIGMPMELELEILKVTADGDEVMIYRFRPCDGEMAQ
jgi:uncharacterized OB-fold protein